MGDHKKCLSNFPKIMNSVKIYISIHLLYTKSGFCYPRLEIFAVLHLTLIRHGTEHALWKSTKMEQWNCIMWTLEILGKFPRKN